MNHSSIYYLKTDYDGVFTAIDIETGDVECGDLFSMLKIPNRIYYSKNLQIEYEYIKNILFKRGFKAKVYDKSKIEKGTFHLMSTPTNKYMIKFSNKTEIRNFNSLLPNIDLKRIDSDEDNAIIKSLLRCKELNIKGVTIGSSAYNIWKHSTAEVGKSLSKKFNDNIVDKEMLKCIRDSYRGAINFVNEDLKWNDEKSITLDCNSLYPYCLINNVVPFGEPVEYTYGEWLNHYDKDLVILDALTNTERHSRYNIQYRLALFNVLISGNLKEGHQPVFGIKDDKTFKYKYERKIRGIFWLWEEELEELKKHYDFDNISIFRVLAFKAVDGKRFFGKFFEKYNELKVNAGDDYLTKQIAKLMLNNLIGKFATKNEMIVEIETENGKFERKKIETYDYYIAIASYVLSKARIYMMSIINLFGNKFVYTDTDSITFLGDKIPNFMKELIDETEFGKFKIESVNSYFHLIRCKQYEKMTSKGIKRTISGCPMDNIYDFEKFEFGAKIDIDIWTNDFITGKPSIVKTKFRLGD